ncbi:MULTISPECIES: anti-sigma factor family protein [Streptomyces]|uniref:Zf-HC2 domain-containing protein n=1 Tax=Streptomyces apricus TaxID=1828112 RepID=A0A5B0B3I5_9ACTN|nr:zf-HC2 domain-containing protein [Streptomyces apricus]KAA0935269.1 zf-HC2 domain-containing protein [Streptomyces apricus]
MSGSRLNPADGPLAEEHLGDRLSALVDGELGHEARERVLAHLATCTKCKTEADEQRRLKNVFAEVSAPPPSESFLARLQGLPGGDPDAESPRLGRGSFGASGVFDLKPDSFGYVPSGPHATVLPPEQRGFRIHDMNRREAERSASRGLRLAAAAAGAVSLAAIALGGVSTGVGVDTTDARGGSGAGSNVTPARSTASTSGTAGTDAQRRRSVAPLLAQGQRSFGNEGGAQTELSAPLLPGVPAPGTPAPAGQGRGPLHTLTTPVVVGAAAMSPLIRPFAPAPPVTLTAWSSGPEFEASVLSAVPSTVPSADPSASPTPSSSG